MNEHNVPTPSETAKVPQVTIGMPVYNGAKFIREALDSLLAQTFSNFELIISDNASTDATQAICEEYVCRDLRIRYVRQSENRGAAANFQFVLDEAVGEYFMWAAADDQWDANWLSNLLKNFDAADFALRGLVKYQKNGVIIHAFAPSSFLKGELIRCFLEDEKLGRAHHIYGLFKTTLIRSTDFSHVLRLKYSPDILLIFNFIKLGNLRTIPETYYIYRQHEDSCGGAAASEWNSLARIIYRVHPWRYYKSYWDNSSGKTRLQLILLTPYKHLCSQIYLWWRGFRKIFLGLENH